MSGLVLKLNPRERILVNGAVIVNCDRRASLCIVTPDAHILRLRDAISPQDVNTPVKRVCYVAQLALSGDANESEAKQQVLRGIEQLSQVMRDNDSRAHLTLATTALIGNDFYRALKSLRNLLPREARLLAHDLS